MQITNSNIEIDLGAPDKARFTGHVHVPRTEFDSWAAGTSGEHVWRFVETVASIRAAHFFDDTLTTFRVVKDSYSVTVAPPSTRDSLVLVISVDVALDKPQKKVKIATESVHLERPDAEWNF